MKKSPLKPGRPRRLTEEEKAEAWLFRLEAIGRPCAVCGGISSDAHHVIAAQTLRRDFPDHVYAKDNCLPICRDCHERHENASHRIPRRCLRPENEQFAKELGLEHLLERFYPQESRDEDPGDGFMGSWEHDSGHGAHWGRL